MKQPCKEPALRKKSELNAAYATIENGNLYLLITGNIEANYNHLNIFFDSTEGGQNTLQNDANNGGSNPENDGWAFNYVGFTFDAGFAPDYMLSIRRGNDGTSDQFNIDLATIGGGLGAFDRQTDVFGGSCTGSAVELLGLGISIAYDNSNIQGILGGTNKASGASAKAVTTGFEIMIPLAALGAPKDALRICAVINNNTQTFTSNQFLGGLTAPHENLGEDVEYTDLSDIPGKQFFTVVPKPSAILLEEPY